MASTAPESGSLSSSAAAPAAAAAAAAAPATPSAAAAPAPVSSAQHAADAPAPPAPFSGQTADGRFKLTPVRDNADRLAFIKAGVTPYQGDSNYIRPLDKDLNNVFDPAKNRFFKHGEAERWLLQDAQGSVIGRTAAFINKKTVKDGDVPGGGMGFFECLNDQAAANALFDTCRDWNAARGMEAMDGPINFGERQAFWGLLVDGFDSPAYQMNYNPPFYKQLFEQYGFLEYFQQYTYGMKVHDERPKKYYERADQIFSDPDYSFRHVEMDKLDAYAEDFRRIFNEAFSMHAGREMSEAAARKMMQSMKPVIVDYIMWFGYHKDRPIAFFINIPDINQYFKHVNGNMNWWGKAKFFYHSRVNRTVKKFIGVVFGVVPDFQAKGLEGAIIIAAHNRIAPSMKWFDIELQWIGDFNPKMMRVAENLGAEIMRTHITYRYLFDRNREFVRHPIIH